MEQILAPLVSSGVTGAMLAYFMWFHAKELKEMRTEIRDRLLGVENAQDRANQLDIARLIASPHVAPEIKEHVVSMLTVIKDADAERKTP